MEEGTLITKSTNYSTALNRAGGGLASQTTRTNGIALILRVSPEAVKLGY